MILIMIIGSFDHLMIMFLESFGLAPQKEAPSPPSIRQSAATGGLSLECWWFSLGWIADTSWRIAREVPGIRDCMGGGVIHRVIEVFMVIFLCKILGVKKIWFIIKYAEHILKVISYVRLGQIWYKVIFLPYICYLTFYHSLCAAGDFGAEHIVKIGNAS